MGSNDFGDDPPRICIVDDDEAFISHVNGLRKPFGTEELEGLAARLIERRRARGT